MTAVDTPPPKHLTLEAAFERFSGDLHRFLASRVRQVADADDLLQQVFLRLVASPPESLPEERMGAWLYRVARNVLIDGYRRGRLREAGPLPSDLQAAPDEAAWSSLAQCLSPLVRTLPSKYAEVLRLTDIDGRRHRDVAAELGLTTSAVKTRAHRGRALLRESLLRCCRPDSTGACACDDDAACR